LFMSLDPVASLLLWGGQPYKIPEVVPTTVRKKQCLKVISHTRNFSLFTTWLEEKGTTTTTASTQDPSIQQKQIDKIVEEHQDIPTTSSPIESLHTMVDHAARLVKQIQPLQQHVHNNLQLVKQDNFFSKANISPKFRLDKSFPEIFTQWIQLLPKGGGLIQEEIGGHPPIPFAQNRGFHLGNFSTSFWVLNFWGRFEALNNVFWAHHSNTIGFSYSVMEKCVVLI
jgi:hypothetical protein